MFLSGYIIDIIWASFSRNHELGEPPRPQTHSASSMIRSTNLSYLLRHCVSTSSDGKRRLSHFSETAPVTISYQYIRWRTVPTSLLTLQFSQEPLHQCCLNFSVQIKHLSPKKSFLISSIILLITRANTS